MKISEALELYCQSTGVKIRLDELRWHESAANAVNNILAIAERTERMGGTLRSRQLISAIVVFSDATLKP